MHVHVHYESVLHAMGLDVVRVARACKDMRRGTAL